MICFSVEWARIFWDLNSQAFIISFIAHGLNIETEIHLAFSQNILILISVLKNRHLD